MSFRLCCYSICINGSFNKLNCLIVGSLIMVYPSYRIVRSTYLVNSLEIVYVSNSDDESLSLQSIIGISSCDCFETLLVLFQLYVTSSQRVLYSDNSRVVVCCGSSSCIDFVFDMLYFLTSVFLWICSIPIYQYFFDKSIRIR